ncbi:MAG: DUF2059 domain-containing protein [Cyclobacteriaceae bacterium]|nr:DUF2059 domain-containing protein [Cyclobacteriaceae bacterium]UYN86983.1 MAG: DUF2059 domain-containing protein [Cyclobacteriaceae bacterium]
MKTKIIIPVLLTLFFVTAATAQDSYTVLVKKYFEASGSAEAFKGAITSMMTNFKSMNNQVPDEFWKEMEKEMLSTSIDDLVKMMVPVYKAHLTEADLKDIVKFYETPSGKKLAQKTPVITQESMQAGQVWGQAVAAKVMKKMQEKGY